MAGSDIPPHSVYTWRDSAVPGAIPTRQFPSTTPPGHQSTPSSTTTISPIRTACQYRSMAGGRGCLKLARLSSARPLVPGSSPLLDLLAPRVFRGVDSASTRWGTAARAGSSAAAVRPVEGHPAVAEDAADSDGDGKGETAVAGPSRWAGQLSESKGGVPTEYKAAAYKGKGRQSGTALHIPTISVSPCPLCNAEYS